MDFNEIQNIAIRNNNNIDPFSDESSWPILREHLTLDSFRYLIDPDGSSKFVDFLPKHFSEKDVANHEIQRCWELIGNYFKNQYRYHDAQSIYLSLYDHLLFSQEFSGNRLHKGTPLVWIGECFSQLHFPVHAKRYVMLSLCEDSTETEGNIPLEKVGSFWRLVYRHGLSKNEFQRYSKQIYGLYKNDTLKSQYPEWILQQLDSKWMVEVPAPVEGGYYIANSRYIKSLLSQLGEGTGQILEFLAGYILSCMAGCKIGIRKYTHSTDIDIVCSMEGFEVDFRSEFGRYFVCECKDWKDPVDFSALAKFSSVLDSVKCRFGILFAREGITGSGNMTNAERQIFKFFQSHGVVIVVLDRNDLEQISNGANLISIIREKYERVRLDLR